MNQLSGRVNSVLRKHAEVDNFHGVSASLRRLQLGLLALWLARKCQSAKRPSCSERRDADTSMKEVERIDSCDCFCTAYVDRAVAGAYRIELYSVDAGV